MLMSIFFFLGAFRTFYYAKFEAKDKKNSWRVMFVLLGLAELLLSFYLSPFSFMITNLEQYEIIYHYLTRAVVVLFLILGWTESKNLGEKKQKKVKSAMVKVYVALTIYIILKYFGNFF